MRTKNRNVIDDDADDDMVRDGEIVHVPLHLTDGSSRFATSATWYGGGHRPGHAQMTDAQRLRRAEARDAMIKTASEAWRMAGRDQKPEPDDPDNGDDDDTNDRARAYRDYKNELQNAWRRPSSMPMVTGFGPSAVGAGPSIVAPGPTTRNNRDAKDARAAADAAYTQYCNRLYSAWRGGR